MNLKKAIPDFFSKYRTFVALERQEEASENSHPDNDINKEDVTDNVNEDEIEYDDGEEFDYDSTELDDEEEEWENYEEERPVFENSEAIEPITQEDDSKDSKSNEHDGKYYVVKKGTAKCDKGSSFPHFNVISHHTHFINGKEDDYLAVTDADVQFNPIAAPFGSCKLKHGTPCTFVPAGKWQKPYPNKTVMGNHCLTELSELQCAVGGKITVKDHGQAPLADKKREDKTNKKEVSQEGAGTQDLDEEIEYDYE